MASLDNGSAMASFTTIPEFYQDKCVFITGATGFMGKALLEKLLRSCPDIRRVYILIRPKKGKEVSQRLEELLNSEIFQKLNKENNDFRSKIVLITGDIVHDNLGMSEQDEQTLIDEVSVVFHSAATVRFDEELKLSVEMNVLGVYRVIQLLKKMKHLEAFLHVSTAYANCHKRTVEEHIYDPPIHPHKLLDAVGWMESDVLQILTPKMIGDRPNTYTYTKSIAEYLVKEECANIPTAIFRPSIVCATWSDPIEGWIDNYNGPTGIMASLGTGVLRVMRGDRHAISDIIPVDMACSMMIATAWYTGTHRSKEMKVFNCTTGSINSLTWGDMEDYTRQYSMKNPFNTVTRVPSLMFTKCVFWHDINVLFNQVLPSYLLDMYMWSTGKKPIFRKLEDRLRKATAILDYFTNKDWEFKSDNLDMLLAVMSPGDRKTFNFDPRSISWPRYIEAYCLGIKCYVMKEELAELPKARTTLKRLQRLSFATNTLVIIIVWRILINRVSIARSMWNFLLHWVVKFFNCLPKIAKIT
ncbi:fatty acyl-CoA reductase 1-like isoform X1 [Mizuhopecten yessoensis]|uniref:fatty acyl-CoA reductase 1-like isoform X1 n=1 Tax=Mizuhopecten yessoensis TaxID=6573 RepID=UPI000B45D34D|nr:fatty acyl-CoA reductase 1-like isoform X1 [Mizuhopecten yessoensis]